MAGLRRAQTTTGGVAAPPRYNTGTGTNPRLAGSPPGPRLGSALLSKQALANRGDPLQDAAREDVVQGQRAQVHVADVAVAGGVGAGAGAQAGPPRPVVQ